MVGKQVREGEIPAAASRSVPTPPTPQEDPVQTMPNPVQQEIEVPVLRESSEEQVLRNANYWNRQLDEDNFHDIVNEDDQMYDDIDAAPVDGDNMVNQILAIVKNHVSEVWSPPRVNKLAIQYGLQPGFSYDIQVDDDNGIPWDLDIPTQRAKCIRNIIDHKSSFVSGSPMCTALSALQGLNKSRMSKDKWDA